MPYTFMMNNLKTRDSYWDVVKGVLIILVILGHAIQCGVGGDFWHHPLLMSIYTFHMPLFMLISGYFAWNGVRGNISWPVKRIRQLLLPCMMVSFLLATAFALSALRHGDEARLIAAFKRCTFPSLWYLCVLLECSIFGWLMFRCRALWWRTVWVILPVIVALAIPYTGRFNVVVIRLFPHGGCFLFLWPFFLIGLMMRWGEAQRWLGSHWMGLSVPLAVLCCVFFRKADYVYITPLSLEPHSWWPSLFRFVAGLAGSFAVLYLLKLLHPFLKHWTWLIRTGTATMAIYILQDMFWQVRGAGITRKIVTLAESYGGSHVILLPLLTLILTLALYHLYQLLRRNRWLALCLFGEKQGGQRS